MNFQKVLEANGNSVVMFGMPTEIGGGQYTQAQKLFAKCKITDDQGKSHTVNIYQGNEPSLISLQQLNQRLQFNLSTYKGFYQNKPYTGYSGFWNSTAQVNQTPQNAQQGTQRPPQQANAPQSTPQGVTEQDRQVSIERQAAFKAACEYCGRKELNKQELLEVARAGHYFIQTGNDYFDMPKPDPSITNTGGAKNPEYVGDNPPPPPDDGVPF